MCSNKREKNKVFQFNTNLYTKRSIFYNSWFSIQSCCPQSEYRVAIHKKLELSILGNFSRVLLICNTASIMTKKPGIKALNEIRLRSI